MRQGYNRTAVDKAIQASRRHGRPIGAAEAKAIHRLLAGRHEGKTSQPGKTRRFWEPKP